MKIKKTKLTFKNFRFAISEKGGLKNSSNTIAFFDLNWKTFSIMLKTDYKLGNDIPRYSSNLLECVIEIIKVFNRKKSDWLFDHGIFYCKELNIFGMIAPITDSEDEENE